MLAGQTEALEGVRVDDELVVVLVVVHLEAPARIRHDHAAIRLQVSGAYGEADPGVFRGQLGEEARVVQFLVVLGSPAATVIRSFSF